jgi:hypothetical protein
MSDTVSESVKAAMRQRIEELDADNRVLTQALQAIEKETTIENARWIATAALDRPAHRCLYG